MTNTFSWQAKSQSSTVESCARLCKKQGLGIPDCGLEVPGKKGNGEVRTKAGYEQGVGGGFLSLSDGFGRVRIFARPPSARESGAPAYNILASKT